MLHALGKKGCESVCEVARRVCESGYRADFRQRAQGMEQCGAGCCRAGRASRHAGVRRRRVGWRRRWKVVGRGCWGAARYHPRSGVKPNCGVLRGACRTCGRGRWISSRLGSGVTRDRSESVKEVPGAAGSNIRVAACVRATSTRSVSAEGDVADCASACVAVIHNADKAGTACALSTT
jgi:hypothetical protein